MIHYRTAPASEVGLASGRYGGEKKLRLICLCIPFELFYIFMQEVLEMEDDREGHLGNCYKDSTW